MSEMDSNALIVPIEKADVNMRDYNEVTPLMYAVGRVDLKSVKFLLANGARVNDQHPVLGNALTVASMMEFKGENHLRIVEELLKNGANVHVRAGGVSALKLAFYQGSHEIAKLLVKNGARDNDMSMIEDQQGDVAIYLTTSMDRDKANIHVLQLFMKNTFASLFNSDSSVALYSQEEETCASEDLECVGEVESSEI